MGVPTFFKWLSIKYPKVLKDAVEQEATEVDDEVVPVNVAEASPNGEFDNLYLDMNGIIHPCCHPEDSDVPSNEDEMFKSIFEYIDRLMTIVRPRKLLYMAIDGVAPRAKMNQQRTRRFKAAAEADQEEATYKELKEQFETEGREAPAPKQHWDSNVITPGTPFFARLTTALQYYINEQMSSNTLWRGLKVVLSDASCPGEGEHKIMQYIRAQRTYPDYNPNLRHCLHGADADLIMLGLATHEPHFCIMREAVGDAAEFKKCGLCGRAGHITSECNEEFVKEPETTKSHKSAWKPLQFLSISVLREYLQNEFTFRDSPVKNFEPDFERCVDDFVLMCFFVGNDFLPHLPSLSIHKGSIDQMMLLYQKIRPLMSDYLTNAGELNLGPLKVFVTHLGKVEEVVFQDELKRQSRFKQRRQEVEAVTTPVKTAEVVVQKIEVVDENFAALRDLKAAGQQLQLATTETPSDSAVETTSEEEPPPIPPAKKQKVSREENIDDFKAQMRAKHKNASQIDDPEDLVQLGMGEKNEWRERYYKKKFHLTAEDMETLDVFAGRVANAYAEGLSWVLHYYYQGVVSWEWYYPFHYAPFASDIAQFGLDKQKIFVYGNPFKPFEQLMAVLPARSSHCLPAALARLMQDPESPIIDFYPQSFKEDPDGKRFKWQWVALLPFIDQQRLLNALKPIESQLAEEEMTRNTTGTDRLFVSQFHPLAQQIASVQNAPKEAAEGKQKIQADLSDSLCGELCTSKLGFVTGAVIKAGKHASTELFPPLAAACLSCEFVCAALHPHSCRFLAGSIIAKPILGASDFIEDSSRDRRFNAGAAKRIIMGSLGKLGIIPKDTVDQFFRKARDPTTVYNNTYEIKSDNPYQAEMFGSSRQKRGRPEDWVDYNSSGQQQSQYPPATRRQYDNRSSSSQYYDQQYQQQNGGYYSAAATDQYSRFGVPQPSRNKGNANIDYQPGRPQMNDRRSGYSSGGYQQPYQSQYNTNRRYEEQPQQQYSQQYSSQYSKQYSQQPSQQSYSQQYVPQRSQPHSQHSNRSTPYVRPLVSSLPSSLSASQQFASQSISSGRPNAAPNSPYINLSQSNGSQRPWSRPKDPYSKK